MAGFGYALPEQLKKLHDPANGQMRVVGLMSGSGTNLRKIIEHEHRLRAERGTAPYTIAAIFSSAYDNTATKIGNDYDLPVITRDIRGFYAARAKPLSDMTTRAEFDAETVKALRQYDATVAAYAGYMLGATQTLVDAFLGINIHPADLSITCTHGRKYAGKHAVRDAIQAGEKQIRATAHLVEQGLDKGRLLMISAPLEVILGDNFDREDEALVKKVAEQNQARLKEAGDWIIFPLTLQYIAEGRYATDSKGKLYFDGKPIPKGVRLEG